MSLVLPPALKKNVIMGNYRAICAAIHSAVWSSKHKKKRWQSSVPYVGLNNCCIYASIYEQHWLSQSQLVGKTTREMKHVRNQYYDGQAEVGRLDEIIVLAHGVYEKWKSWSLMNQGMIRQGQMHAWVIHHLQIQGKNSRDLFADIRLKVLFYVFRCLMLSAKWYIKGYSIRLRFINT